MEDEMTEHTPGPWNIGSIQFAGGACTNIEPGICIVQGHGRTPTANARLIAAAPALLAELRDLAHLAGVLNSRQHAGLPITPAMWSALYNRTNAAQAAIAAATA